MLVMLSFPLNFPHRKALIERQMSVFAYRFAWFR